MMATVHHFLKCAGCSSTADMVKRLIRFTDDFHICDLCVRICVEMLDEADAKDDAKAKTAESKQS